MKEIVPQQTPCIEGELDQMIGSNRRIGQDTYFEISQIINPRTIKINGGNLHNLFPDNSVDICLAGKSNLNNNNVIATGKIENSNLLESSIHLEKPLEVLKAENYWVYLKKANKDHLDLSININKLNQALQREMKLIVSAEKYLKLSDNNADVKLVHNNEWITLSSPENNQAISKIKSREAKLDARKLLEKLTTYAKGKFLKELKLNSENYKVTAELIRIDQSHSSLKLFNETPYVIADKDVVQLKVRNHGNKDAFFSILDIAPDGSIFPIAPRPEQINSNEYKIKAGQEMVLKDIRLEIMPPYGRDVLKVISGPQPINYSAVANIRGTPTLLSIKRLINGVFGTGASEEENYQYNLNDIEGHTYEWPYLILEKEP